eukprot:g42112.t1
MNKSDEVTAYIIAKCADALKIGAQFADGQTMWRFVDSYFGGRASLAPGWDTSGFWAGPHIWHALSDLEYCLLFALMGTMVLAGQGLERSLGICTYEPGPAKVAVTSNSIPTAEKIPSTRSTLWQEQEELKNKELHVISPTMKSPSENQSSIVPSSEPSAGLKEAAQSVVDVNEVDSQQKKRVESGYFSLEKLKSETKQLITPPRSSITSSPSQSSFDSETSGATLSSIASSSSRVGEGSSHSPATRINLDYAKMADVPKAKRISDKQAFQANKDQEQRFRTCSPGRAELTRLFGTER